MISTSAPPSDAPPTEEHSELDLYAAEFAKLVRHYPPARTDAPSDWLAQLPDEAFEYFHRGTATFGRTARSPIERRGRLYLIHTALVFMWMSWGKQTARERFQKQAEKGTRRAASLIALEHYRRGGVVADYAAEHWFFQPIDRWTVRLFRAAVRADAVSDPDRRSRLRDQSLVQCTVDTFSELRAEGALPRRDALSLG